MTDGTHDLNSHNPVAVDPRGSLVPGNSWGLAPPLRCRLIPSDFPRGSHSGHCSARIPSTVGLAIHPLPGLLPFDCGVRMVRCNGSQHGGVANRFTGSGKPGYLLGSISGELPIHG